MLGISNVLDIINDQTQAVKLTPQVFLEGNRVIIGFTTEDELKYILWMYLVFEYMPLTLK